MVDTSAHRRSRVWNSLGTRRAAQIVTVMVIVYFLVIGLLVIGYVQVSNCLASYANKSASSTEARARASAQDRALNDEAAQLADVERERSRLNDEALADLLAVIAPGRTERNQAEIEAKFTRLLEVNQTSAQVFQDNERKRDQIQRRRAEIERQRASNPVPPPPSQSC